MAKKSVDASLAAYSNKGMKAPRPSAYGELDPSKAPKNKGPMHKDPPYEKASAEMAKMAPEHKKKPLTTKEAPEGVKGVNEGSPMELPKHLNEKK